MCIVLVSTGGIFDQLKDAVVTQSMAEIISIKTAVFNMNVCQSLLIIHLRQVAIPKRLKSNNVDKKKTYIVFETSVMTVDLFMISASVFWIATSWMYK